MSVASETKKVYVFLAVLGILCLLTSHSVFAASPVETHCITVLKSLTKTPPRIVGDYQGQLRSFTWKPGVTVFLNKKGKEIDPGLFLSLYKGRTVEITLGSNNVATRVRRVDI